VASTVLNITKFYNKKIETIYITSDINKKRVMRCPLNKKVFYEEDKKGVEVSSNTSTPSAQHIR
jgi:hypothetical protein